uniref:Uncharacterized protein n=1 Tax=Nicotiana tabacum TaxID=4097 RepID=A0A1S4DIA9_TOBAC|nr:PREDICTED: uncharacterized protein LOC107830160 [Nicotiana tabacum]
MDFLHHHRVSSREILCPLLCSSLVQRSQLNHSDNFIPFSMNDRGPIINHLTYANDLVVFSSGNSKSIKDLMKQIKWYEKNSGQKVNKDKSFFLTAPRTRANRINKIREATGFLEKEFPFHYLGCPIYVGRKKVEYFEGMLAKIIKRMNGWQRKMLSYGGRIILIKHVLQSLPTYTMTSLNPPKSILNLMERHFATFFWASNGDKNNYHWSSWANLCYPKEEGGVGFRRMTDICDSLTVERWWGFRSQPTL